MNPYLFRFKKWYDYRSTRERLFILGLCFAFMYAGFYFFIYSSIENRQMSILSQIRKINDNNKSWSMQIEAIKKISDSPLYQKWLSQQQQSINIRGKYQSLLKTFSLNQWQNIIKTVLQPQPNIRLVEIKNFPETAHTPLMLEGEKKKIYQRTLLLVVYSNFFDTLNYMNKLETAFPNIHWTSLNYEVLQYPVAKVEMELSVFYEKNQ